MNISNISKQAVVIATAIAMIWLVGSAMNNLSKDEAGFYEVEMNVSAYCTCEKCCGVWATKGINSKGNRITASGVPAVGKMIAAPKTYAFKTKMDIPGYGTALVQDRGGAIKGDKLDLLFPSHQAALNWGRQYVKVRVYK